MSKFVVIIFPDEKKAYEGVRALQGLHAEGSITLYSHSVMQRDPKGFVSVKEEQDEGPVGTAVGALVGALIGMFGGPVGVAIGLGGGTALGALRDLFSLGMSDDFIDSVSRDLTPGKTAVVAEISEEWITPLDTRVEALGGTVVREIRDDFIDQQIEKRIAHIKAEFAQSKAERARAKAAKMETKIEKAVSKAETKLRASADNAKERMEDYRQEIEAKVYALHEQASKAKPEAKAQIDQRIAEMRDEAEQRIAKLDQAYRITQEALRP